MREREHECATAAAAMRRRQGSAVPPKCQSCDTFSSPQRKTTRHGSLSLSFFQPPHALCM
eukprot:c32050_g1_i1 orf=246-425(+)